MGRAVVMIWVTGTASVACNGALDAPSLASPEATVSSAVNCPSDMLKQLTPSPTRPLGPPQWAEQMLTQFTSFESRGEEIDLRKPELVADASDSGSLIALAARLSGATEEDAREIFAQYTVSVQAEHVHKINQLLACLSDVPKVLLAQYGNWAARLACATGAGTDGKVYKKLQAGLQRYGTILRTYRAKAFRNTEKSWSDDLYTFVKEFDYARGDAPDDLTLWQIKNWLNQIRMAADEGRLSPLFRITYKLLPLFPYLLNGPSESETHPLEMLVTKWVQHADTMGAEQKTRQAHAIAYWTVKASILKAQHDSRQRFEFHERAVKLVENWIKSESAKQEQFDLLVRLAHVPLNQMKKALEQIPGFIEVDLLRKLHGGLNDALTVFPAL